MRDLLLNKIPKDFDVITTANLDQVIFFTAFRFFFSLYSVAVNASCYKVQSFYSWLSSYQIKKQFRRAIIVGQRFPICRVHIQGSVTEVCYCISYYFFALLHFAVLFA